ncbi:huwentoxin-IV family protein [Paraglaciecola sp. T6c]
MLLCFASAACCANLACRSLRFLAT